MVKTYGELVKLAREQHSPPMTRKHLAEKLKVTAPFITDIEKNRRLPSLDNQEKIKKLLVNEQLSAFLFDDLAAAGNEDKRIVAEDITRSSQKRSPSKGRHTYEEKSIRQEYQRPGGYSVYL